MRRNGRTFSLLVDLNRILPRGRLLWALAPTQKGSSGRFLVQMAARTNTFANTSRGHNSRMYSVSLYTVGVRSIQLNIHKIWLGGRGIVLVQRVLIASVAGLRVTVRNRPCGATRAGRRGGRPGGERYRVDIRELFCVRMLLLLVVEAASVS